MNRDQKAAVVEEVAGQIRDAEAIFAIDYRGLSVTQAVELRARLGEAGATFRVVKNRLTERAADAAGADSLKAFLDGPTAFTFVRGDAALAAKALATFRRENQLLEFKGGTMAGADLSIDEIESIARLPGRDALQAQFVGVLAAPVTGLVRGLGSLVSGLALQLGQIAEQKAADGSGEGSNAEAAPDADEEADDAGAEPTSDAPGDPVAEAEAAEQEETSGADEAPGGDGGDAAAADQDENKEE